MNKEEPPATEFVQDMEYMAGHGVEKAVSIHQLFQQRKTLFISKKLKEKPFKNMTVI